jgi:DNA-binding MarR family transcriptional regulator
VCSALILTILYFVKLNGDRDMDAKYDCLKLDNQLCFPLYAASRKIVKTYTPYLKPLGLTYTQYITLMVLWEKNEVKIKELGEKLFLDTGTLTPLLKKMEEAGLITRKRSSEDERVVNIKITNKGMQLREKCVDIPANVGGCVRLDTDEAKLLHKVLNEILCD